MLYSCYLYISLLFIACNSNNSKKDKGVVVPETYSQLIKKYRSNTSILSNDTIFFKYCIGQNSDYIDSLNSKMVKTKELTTLDGICYEYPIAVIPKRVEKATLGFEYMQEEPYNDLYLVSLVFLKPKYLTRDSLYNSVVSLYKEKYGYNNYAFYDDENIKISSWVKNNIQIDVYTTYGSLFHDGTIVNYYDWKKSETKNKTKQNENTEIQKEQLGKI